MTGSKVQLGILAVAGVLMALVVLTVGLVIGGRDGVSAKPLPRGSLVAVPDKPAVLNRPAVVKTVNGVRGEIKARRSRRLVAWMVSPRRWRGR